METLPSVDWHDLHQHCPLPGHVRDELQKAGALARGQSATVRRKRDGFDVTYRIATPRKTADVVIHAGYEKCDHGTLAVEIVRRFLAL